MPQRQSPKRPRAAVHTTPASLLEALEPRVHLAAFAYQSLAEYLDAGGPMHVLRPSGDSGSSTTVQSSVAALGDVDGDGFPDILVGAAGHGGGDEHGDDDDDDDDGDDRDGDRRRSVAAVYSGLTGSLLFTVSDGTRGFGSSVAGIGDVSGDGTPDFIVGSPLWGAGSGDDDDHDDDDHDDDDDHGDDDDDRDGGSGHSGRGRAYIYSGADGTLLYTLTGEVEGEQFGSAVAAAGDVDGDDVPDVVIGAPGSARGGDDYEGRVSIISGADGSLIRSISGADARSAFGAAVAGAGDIDGDGLDDIVVGAPHTGTGDLRAPGKVYVLSGEDGSVLFTFTGTQERDLFGYSVAAGDVDADGTPDIVVGAPSWRDTDGETIPSAGRVTVYSGETGEEILAVRGERPNGNFGAVVAIAGDVDFDGGLDLLIGQPAANRDARVVVLSGDDGVVLHQFVARSSDLVRSDRLGTSAAAVGDVDGDGFTDFVFGGTKDANPGRGDRSRFYVFSGVSAADLRPAGINDEGVIWGQAGSGEGNVREWIALDGKIRLLSTIDGFTGDDVVLDVSNGGIVLGLRRDGDAVEPFLWGDGERVALEDLIDSTDGPAGTYTAMLAVDITDQGLILVQRLNDEGESSVWVLEDGALTYLFNGVPVRINDSGMVVGMDTGGFAIGEPITNTTIVLAADGTLTEIEGFFAVDLSASGTVLGLFTNDDGDIRSATWADGEATEIPAIAGGERFLAQAINDDGRVIGAYTKASGATGGFFYDPDAGTFDIASITHHAPDTLSVTSAVRLGGINGDGVIVGSTGGAVRTAFALTPSSSMGIGFGRIGGRVDSTLDADGTLSIVTVNAMGEAVVFRRDPATGRWSVSDLSQAAGAPMALDAITYTDPATGRAIIVLAAIDGVYLLSEADGQWALVALSDATGGTAIVAGLTSFITLDGVVYVAGIDENGDLVAYRQDAGGADWAFANVSEDLRAGGADVPSFQGRLVSYVTSWNGLNIAGLDADGHIWTVWTSPVMHGRWTSSNLSRITGTPSLRGGLTPYLTAWGGINLAAVNEDGDTVVTWWVPEFEGRWERNNFTREMGFSKLRPDSISSYVTPWGGLNITGLDDDGEVVVYWWAPESGGWRLAKLDARGDDDDRMLRRVDGYAARDGSMSLLGVGRGGNVLRLHWRADQPWLFENLTEQVRG